MATKIATTLTATVSPYREESRGPNGKVKTFTWAIIKAGNLLVARRVLGGTWNAAQALAEFRRFPSSFVPLKDYASGVALLQAA